MVLPKHTLRVASLLLIVSLFLAACGGDTTTPTATAGAGQTTGTTPTAMMESPTAMMMITPTEAMMGNMTATPGMMMTGTAGMMMTPDMMMTSTAGMMTPDMMMTPGMMMTGTPGMMMTPGSMMTGTGMTGSFSPMPGGATTLNASGATFPKPLYDKQFADYKAKYGVTINYTGGGSGKGKTDLQNNTVDFAGSDSVMSDEDAAKAKGGPVLHIPTALGAVVVIYNIPGYSGKLKLTGENVADIYLGNIKTWNDAKLTANNPELANVSSDITVIHRSDGSGTTNIFSDYLAKKSEQFKTEIGVGTAPKWKDAQTNGVGGNGNQGVAQAVQATAYGIGYVELNYALGAKLSFADLQNKSGSFVTPSLESVTAAAAGATIPDDLRFNLNDTDGAGAYPIAAGTWLLIYQNQTDQAKAVALVNLANWMLTEGQSYHIANAYAPLAPNMIEKGMAQIKKINVNGTVVMP